MQRRQRSVYAVFTVLFAFLLLAPHFGQGHVQASTYSWNIYSQYIEYQPTGERFYHKSCGQVNNATQGYFRLPNTYSSTNIAQYDVGNGRSVELDFGSCSTYGMTHILARHAPELFIGNPTQVQSFFNPGHPLGYYESIIGQIISNNRTQILNNGFTSNGTVVYGNTPHGQVRLVIKGGKVITMYPNGWGLGERKY
ncbi:hypothetical protein P4637_11840 [Halalkalibacterium halodurans]|uniref:BH0295 protein n=2 Tax=Halalkalibacterium halodurans TaxID=86665 RepID=Q9KG20_HALH5|nr:hypothetical protein [Halalkalibacterium halodurans]MDY7220804.1 hypothetical protein [Halalkalibacterium halodurans]MDY7240043.1 hypothetical protein [Halalkalibacterium halodurans]MED4081741.1 hypothetical protein [Halalkalibacterium halodurans]MED4085504.1 hypothetical protein [Halalkalibacterium halodurans]MED4106736.1 hypothetical protein [Halalkalibacterium halodurans]